MVDVKGTTKGPTAQEAKRKQATPTVAPSPSSSVSTTPRLTLRHVLQVRRLKSDIAGLRLGGPMWRMAHSYCVGPWKVGQPGQRPSKEKGGRTRN